MTPLAQLIKELMTNLISYTTNDICKSKSYIIKSFQDSYTRYFIEDYVGALFQKNKGKEFENMTLKQIRKYIENKYKIDQADEQQNSSQYQKLIKAYH